MTDPITTPPSSSLTAEQISDIRFAASLMSGPTRRTFQAEMTLKYCAGRARLAETVFGWNRAAIECGLGERRTGVVCLGAQSALCGRPRWEEEQAEAAEALQRLADAHAQQDPTFRTSLAYTRLTAQAALEALRAEGFGEAQLPSAGVMSEVLNRLGYRLRRVVKAKPLKKIKETDAIFDNVKKKTSRHRKWGTSNDSASIAKRR